CRPRESHVLRHRDRGSAGLGGGPDRQRPDRCALPPPRGRRHFPLSAGPGLRGDHLAAHPPAVRVAALAAGLRPESDGMTAPPVAATSWLRTTERGSAFGIRLLIAVC